MRFYFAISKLFRNFALLNKKERKSVMENLLRENMENAIKRYRKRYEGGHCTYEEYVRLVEWEKKNYESGGVLYADKLAKALTPNPRWKW